MVGRRENLLHAMILAFLLTACSSPEPQDEAQPVEASPSAEISAPAQPPGAPVMLDTLNADDRAENRLDGELGCAFSPSRGDDPLLSAASYVDPGVGGEALVKIDGEPVRLAMDGTGGYDRMTDGVRFAADGLSAQIEVTGDQPLPEDPPIAGESPIYTARLTVERDGRAISIDGFYECGP